MSMDRYEEAMSRYKQWEREHTKGYVIQDMIEFIFPELANEDEKIKRAISYAIAQVKHENGILIDRITEDMALAWLEKQKEQKFNIELIQRSWYMEGYHDAEFKHEPKWIIKTGKGGPRHELNPRYGEPLAEQNPGDKDRYMEGYINGMNEALKELKEQKPAEWNEEDEGMLNCIIATLCEESYGGREANDKMVAWLENRLKSLRPQPHWKPSDEQMDALKEAIIYFGDSWVSRKQKALESLYSDLKKL